MEKNRYYKTTTGVDPLAFVGKNLAYATAATTKLFQETAAEGAVGIYNAETLALMPASAVADPATPLIVLLKRGGATESSTPFSLNRSKITKVAYDAPAKQVTTLTIAGAATPVAGETWALTLFEQTPLNQPFPTWQYQYTVKATDTTIQILLASIAAYINDQTLPQNKGDRLVVASSTATTLVLTANDFNRFFQVSYRQSAAGRFTVALTTPFKFGAGTPDQVLQYDAESNIKKGVTTNYPINGVPSEYGLPLNFVDPALTYTTHIILSGNEEWSPTPVDKHHRKTYQYIFLPVGAGAIASIDAVLGTGPVIP